VAGLEEAGRRPQARGMGGVLWLLEVPAQMDEGAGDLDEALEEGVVAVAGLQPEFFEDIVRLVVLAGIEAVEPCEVARVERESGAGGGDGRLFAGWMFFHRGILCRHYPAPACARQADAETTSRNQTALMEGQGLMPPQTMLLFAGGLVILAVISAFVSALETAFFSLAPGRLDALRARRADLADGVSRMMANPRRLLSAIIIADALANAPLMLGSLALIEGQRGLDIPFWASAMLLFALIVFACDLVPKLVGIGAPMLVVRMGVTVFGRVLPLIDPFARVLEGISEKVADAILPKGWSAQRHLTEDEIGTLVELSATEGALHEIESEMISEIIKLGDKTAKDCMTPRVEMFSLPDDLSNEEVVALVRQRRLRRVPVHGETPDEIEGVLDVPAFLRDPQVPYTEVLGVPSFVPETMKALTLLKSFLSHPQGIAFVVDEHGGLEGIVTLRDLVEEIISDAVPQAEAKLYIEDAGDGRLLASGSARLEDIAEELDVRFNEEGIDTIGGLIFNRLGHLPKKGQKIRLGELHATVRRVSRKRVDEVLLVRAEGEGEAADA